MPRKAANPQALSRRVLVSVDRGITDNTARVVWQHEIPLLEAIHGEGKVVPVDPKGLDEGYSSKINPALLIHNKASDPTERPSEAQALGYVFAGDVAAEYERLAQVYGRHPEVPVSVVEHVYGRFAEGRFSRLVSQGDIDDMPAKQLRDIIIDNGYLPQIGEFSTDEDRRDASRKRAALMAMSRDELLKIAETLVGEPA